MPESTVGLQLDLTRHRQTVAEKFDRVIITIDTGIGNPINSDFVVECGGDKKIYG
jgi:hypothetical protein